MRMIPALVLSLAVPLAPGAAFAQTFPQSSIAEMAETPLVRVNIAETLRTPPGASAVCSALSRFSVLSGMRSTYPHRPLRPVAEEPGGAVPPKGGELSRAA